MLIFIIVHFAFIDNALLRTDWALNTSPN